MRIARPRSASASTATAFAPAPRRRRGMSFFAFCLGTFLHLVSFVRGCGSRSELGHVAGRLRRRRRERQWQRDAYSGSFIDLALYNYLAGMQIDKTFYDRQPEAGSFVPPLIGLARLEEGITDPLEIISRDASTLAETVTLPPRSVNLMALETRFSTICLNARGSPVISGKSSGARLTRSIALSRAFNASRLQQLSSAARGANGSGEISKWPDSIFDMS